MVEEKTSDFSTRMQLQIRDFQASDVGVYTCISTNSLGKSDGTIRFYGECPEQIVDVGSFPGSLFQNEAFRKQLQSAVAAI